MDYFNDIETKLVAWLTADPGITAETIHEKLKGNISDYTSDELPAIGIHVSGFSQGGEIVTGIFEIITAGIDYEPMDELIKKIQSQIIESFRKEFVPGINRSSSFKNFKIISGYIAPQGAIEGMLTGYINFSLEIVL